STRSAAITAALPTVATALPAAAEALSQQPRNEPSGATGTGVRTARLGDPVRDEALSLLMALDPIFPRTNHSDSGAAMAAERPSLAGRRPAASTSPRTSAVPSPAATTPAPTFPAIWPRQRVRSPRSQSTLASAANETLM